MSTSCKIQVIDFDEIIPVDKVSPNIIDVDKFTSLSTYDSSDATILVWITWHEALSKENCEALLIGYYIDLVSFDSVALGCLARGNQQNLIDLAQEPEISDISEIEIGGECNANARLQTNVDSLQDGLISKVIPPTISWLSGIQYTGDSIWIWNGEHGADLHLDLFEFDGTTGDTLFRGGTVLNPAAARPIKGSTGSIGYGGFMNGPMGPIIHGLHTIGTLAGNGWASHTSNNLNGSDTLQWRGVAPKAMILENGDAAGVNNRGPGDVNSHSYIASPNTYYEIDSRLADQALSNHDQTLPIANNNFNNIAIYAAANQGRSPGHCNQIGYYSIMQNTKNGVVVGAVESSDLNVIAPLSSLGPTRDGRIKPDVVAPGLGLQREEMTIEFDSVAIVRNSGVNAHFWNFDENTDGFSQGLYQVQDTTRTGGIFQLQTYSNPSFYADELDDHDTIVMNSTDQIFVRLRIVGSSPLIPDSILLTYIYWGVFGGTYDDGHIEPFQKVSTDNTWIDLTFPLNWTAGDTLSTIRFDFGFNENYIVSTVPGDEYRGQKGTSMACPHVAGIAALMLQKYNEDVIHTRNSSGLSLNIHQNNCWNSTIRGILIHTATDLIDTVGIGFLANPEFTHHSINSSPLYGIGPDWVTGWGLVNAVKALDYMDTTKFIEDTIGAIDTSDTLYIYIPNGTENVKTTLAWDDPAAASHNDSTMAYSPKLVNDLDLLMIREADNSVFRPWILDHSNLNDGLIQLGTNAAITGIDTMITPAVILNNSASRTTGRRDSLNNVEVVEIVNPQAGLWKIVVNANNIGQNQTLPADPANDRQDYSLIFDFPIIGDITTSNWQVSTNGAGDVREIGHALDLASPGDTVTITPGTYSVTTPDSTDSVTLIFQPGATLIFDGFDAFIYVGTGGEIIGADNIVLSDQIILYNTPNAREPLPADNIIGIFGNLCRAMIVSIPGQTTVVGPGEYSIWTVSYEGIIGVRDADRNKSSIIRLYYPDAPVCAPEPPQPPSNQKGLFMNLRFEVNDDNALPNALVLSESEEIEFRNCSFENFDSDGNITAHMIGIGDTGNVRTGVTRFTDCTFRNFQVAIDAFACTTQAQSPIITNTNFYQCGTDITFPPNSEALCQMSGNSMQAITVGTQRYVGNAINDLITATCTGGGGGLPKQNISVSNPSFVDERISDIRLAPRSILIDNGIDNEDIGADNIDMVFTFSRFLDVTVIFDSGDTIVVENGVMTKNTLGSIVFLKQKITIDLRPVYEVVFTTNFIDRPSEVRVRTNDPTVVPELPLNYTVLDAEINGYTFSRMVAADIPTSGDSTVIQVTPDNIPPSMVANVTATQVGSDVNVSWSLNTENDIVRYKVYRTLFSSTAAPEQIASVTRTTSSYTAPAQSTSSYYYSVVAYDSTGNQSANLLPIPAIYCSDSILTLNDVEINADMVVAGEGFRAGLDDLFNMNLTVGGDVVLYDRSQGNGDLTCGGSLSLFSGATWNGSINEGTPVEIEPIGEKTLTVGSEEIWVVNNEKRFLPPGSYSFLEVSSSCTLMVSTGEYTFNYITLHPDAALAINGAVVLNAENDVTISERTSIYGSSTASERQLYSNGNSVWVEDNGDTPIELCITAPNAQVDIRSRAIINGNITAKTVVIDNDAVINGLGGGGVPNNPPTIATPAAATPNPVTNGTSTALSVLGDDDNGEANLTYTWETVGTPPAPVSFSINGTNGAKNTIAFFTNDGNYSFMVTIEDQDNNIITSSVNVTVASSDIVSIEAEDGVNCSWISGTTVDNNHAGFTGTGFVNTPNVVGAWTECQVTFANAGTCRITVRYANGSSARTATLSVNGTDVMTGAFNATGAWTNWTDQVFENVPINAGANTIRLTATTAGGLANIDRFDIVYGELPVYYTLTLNISGNGSIQVSPSGSSHLAGTIVTLSAIPATGYQFTEWSGDLSGTANPASITMDGDKNVTALFTQLSDTVSVEAENTSYCTWSSGSIVESEHYGYTGTGYVNTVNTVGSWTQCQVTVTDAVMYMVNVRYANGSSGRNATISVNGTNVATAPFAGTGSWTNWADQSVTGIWLNSGSNTIRLTATTSGGLSNIDRFDVIK